MRWFSPRSVLAVVLLSSAPALAARHPVTSDDAARVDAQEQAEKAQKEGKVSHSAAMASNDDAAPAPVSKKKGSKKGAAAKSAPKTATKTPAAKKTTKKKKAS